MPEDAGPITSPKYAIHGILVLPDAILLGERDKMNVVDRNFYELADEISRLSEKELYYRMRSSFERVPKQTQKSCADFFNRYGYWGRLEPENGNYEEIELKERTLHEHMDDFVWLYRRLEDYRSKKTLYAILSNWYRYDFTSTTQARESMFKPYFDLDLLTCGQDEVFVDLGAYTGDTVLSYLRCYGEDCYKRIYCYEITPESFEVLSKRLSGLRDIILQQKGVSNGTGSMALDSTASVASANRLVSGEGVEVTTLDVDITEPVTLIKADIEGFEQQAILGAVHHIAYEHPKMLISVYHNNEDLWKIPQMLDQLAPDYKFHLRYDSSPIYPTEITLFAL